MPRTRNKQNETHQVGVGEDFVLHHVGRKSFVRCILEPIKNSRDAHANLILIDTTERDQIAITDDGEGIHPLQNRSRFLKIGQAERRGRTQSLRFDTGRLMLLYTFGEQFLASTVPAEVGDQKLYSIKTDRTELARKNALREEMAFAVQSVNPTNWPHPFRTGTSITYTFENPSNRGIRRGAALAKMLAERLPIKFRRIIQVDGEWLPEKAILGDVYDAIDNSSPQLGPVVFELYQPEQRGGSHEALWLAGEEIGDADIQALYRALRDDALRAQFPMQLLDPRICGTISCSLFANFTNPDRDTIDPAIAQDARMFHLICVLKTHLPAILDRLNVTRPEGIDREDDSRIWEEVRQRCNRKFDPTGEGPPPSTRLVPPPPPEPDEEGEQEETGPEPPPGPPGVQPPITITGARRNGEVTPGETIELAARARPDLLESVDHLRSVRWQVDNGRLTNLHHPAPHQLVATVGQQLGPVKVRVDVPNTPYSRELTMQVVAERQLRLVPEVADLLPGETQPLVIVNSDITSGQFTWSKQGPGQLKIKARSATFTAEQLGLTTITVADQADSGRTATATLTTLERQRATICIAGHWFVLLELNFNPSTDRNLPVVMTRGDQVHDLIINRGAPGYKEAQERGDIETFLLMAVSLAFARFRRFDLEADEMVEIDERDVETIQRQLEVEAFSLFRDLMTA